MKRNNKEQQGKSKKEHTGLLALRDPGGYCSPTF